MAFSQLSGSSISNPIHHFSNLLAGGSRSHHDDYGSKGYKSTTSAGFEGYGSKPSYGGQSGGARNEYGSYGGSRGGDYGSQGSGSYGGSGGHRVNMDSSSYKKPNESSGSRSRGWDDVKNAERA